MGRVFHYQKGHQKAKHLYNTFIYFFNIPNNAHNIYTLKNTKIHIKNT